MKRLIPTSLLLCLLTSCGGYDQRGDVRELYKRIEDTNTRVGDLETRVNTYIVQVESNTRAITNHHINMGLLESNLTDINTRLGVLETDTPRIVDVKPACEGSKEVLLELDTGELLGYFEQGNKRYLTILEAGTYRTTDSVGCTFTVE